MADVFGAVMGVVVRCCADAERSPTPRPPPQRRALATLQATGPPSVITIWGSPIRRRLLQMPSSSSELFSSRSATGCRSG